MKLSLLLLACLACSPVEAIAPSPRDYPCGTQAHVCPGSHMCCGDDETCGGVPGSVGCPAGMCCAAGDDPFLGKRRMAPVHPQTPEASWR